MKPWLLTLIVFSLIFGPAGYSIADNDNDRSQRGLRHIVNQLQQNVEQNRSDIDNNAAAIESSAEKIQANADKSAANMADIQNNAANIADNFSQIQSNRMDLQNLDSRVSELEAGGPPGGGGGNIRTFVDVDCNEDPNALFLPPINGFYPDSTTYNIHGACNGPVYVTEDFVRFVGVGPDAAIVLPADTPSPGDGTVFGDGAQDLRIQNLLIDASAWGTAQAEGTDAAGVYARNAFVRVRDSTVVGGLFGINPFRNAIVRLEGTVNVREFVNSGISVGDQSLVTTRGQVNVSTTRTDGSYLIGVEVYRSGIVDFRRGLFVDVPPTDFSTNFFSNSLIATSNSHVRIRNSGLVDLTGEFVILSSSNLSMQGGTVRGNFSLREGAVGQIFNVTQVPPANPFSSLNQLRGNASLIAVNSDLQRFHVDLGSVLESSGGTLGGAEVSKFSSLLAFGTTIEGSIEARKPSTLTVFGGSANSDMLICEEDTVEVDPNIFIPPAALVDVCP